MSAKKRTKRLFLLSSIIIIYMLLALIWWSILLLRNNKEVFELRKELVRLSTTSDPQSIQLEEAAISAEFQRQKLMIVGEGVVFSLALLMGIWFINRGYSREIHLARQKRNFLLAITHELKSPLASIKIVLETLRKHKLENKQVDKVADTGLDETERLANLVENLLLAAKLDKFYRLHPVPIDLIAMSEEIIAKLEQKYPEMAYDFVSAGNSVKGEFDETGIYTILYNLLENAAKYGQSAKPIELKLSTNQKYTEIRVTDFGEGIPEADKAELFKQFYRGGNEETRRSKGTGLGLYIVKKLVDLHDGMISVSDTYPKGTTFTVRLPRK